MTGNYTLFTSAWRILFLLFWLTMDTACYPSTAGQANSLTEENASNFDRKVDNELITGAEQLGLYVPGLRGKRVGLVVNHSAIVGKKHLLDTLLSLDIDVRKVFSPEHGFRGEEADGAVIEDGKDSKSGLPVVSLYGKNKKPSPGQLEDIDILVFDLQDVGVRFYTYLSTLHYIMEAAAEQGKSVVVLDRPNPNGHFIDGPVLEDDKKYHSFIGIHPVPVVYGMTIGEYARMINGEGWLANKASCVLEVIPLMNYNRDEPVRLKVKPSPNLPNPEAVLLYPSLAFFEGTTVSVGRGTDIPFQCFGHPEYMLGSYIFTPVSMRSSREPKWEGKPCNGVNLQGLSFEEIASWKKINLSFLTGMYEVLGGKVPFFREDGYFEKLAGTGSLRKALEDHAPEEQIRADWTPGIERFKQIRSKYLLYRDHSGN